MAMRLRRSLCRWDHEEDDVFACSPPQVTGILACATLLRFIFHPRGCVQPFHAYFIPIDPRAARLRPSLRGGGVPYLFIFRSSSVK